MTSYELSETIVEKHIKTRTELLALAQLQKEEGKSDIAEFIVNRGSKVGSEVMKTAWELKNAPTSLERESKTRLTLLEECLQNQCVPGRPERNSFLQNVLRTFDT